MLHFAAIVILALVLWGLIANYRIERKAKDKEFFTTASCSTRVGREKKEVYGEQAEKH